MLHITWLGEAAQPRQTIEIGVEAGNRRNVPFAARERDQRVVEVQFAARMAHKVNDVRVEARYVR